MTGRLFTSESVTEGHPDKIADAISDTVLDYLLAHDEDKQNLRVAVETLLTTGLVVVAGEVRTNAYADGRRAGPREVLDIGYDSSLKGFDGKSCGVQVAIGGQSTDIAAGRRPGPRGTRRRLRRRARQAGRRRPGPDVRLRLRRHPRADAAADHDRAPALRAPDRGPQGRHARLPAPGRQDPGHHRVRRRGPSRPRRHRGALDPARGRRRRSRRSRPTSRST